MPCVVVELEDKLEDRTIQSQVVLVLCWKFHVCQQKRRSGQILRVWTL